MTSVLILQARPLYNLMSLYKLKLKPETFRSMISLCVKMKDVSQDGDHLLFLDISYSMTLLFIDLFSFQFEGAYTILTDAEESGETSTVSLYNVIMAGYFREVNSCLPCLHFVLTYLLLTLTHKSL